MIQLLFTRTPFIVPMWNAFKLSIQHFAVEPLPNWITKKEITELNGRSGTIIHYFGYPPVLGLENSTETHSVDLNANRSFYKKPAVN